MRKLVFAFPPCLTELKIFLLNLYLLSHFAFTPIVGTDFFFFKRMWLISASVFWYFIQIPIILPLEYVDFIYLFALFVHLFMYLFTDIVSISHLVESFFPWCSAFLIQWFVSKDLRHCFRILPWSWFRKFKVLVLQVTIWNKSLVSAVLTSPRMLELSHFEYFYWTKSLW